MQELEVTEGGQSLVYGTFLTLKRLLEPNDATYWFFRIGVHLRLQFVE